MWLEKTSTRGVMKKVSNSLRTQDVKKGKVNGPASFTSILRHAT